MRKLAFFMASAALAVCAVLPAVAQRGALTAADYARAEKVHELQRDAAGVPLRRARQLVAGRPGLVSRDDRDGQRGDAGRSQRPATKTTCDLPACVAAAGGRGGRGGQGGGRGAARTDVPSPDGKRTAFIKDWNLWVRDIATGKETQLTTDGIKDFGYATDNAGWTKSDRAILIWSPDSKQIATFQQDQRKVGEMYLVSTEVGHPRLEAWKYPLPGDKDVAMIHRVVIDARHREGVALQERSGPAPLDALRSHRLRRRMVRRLLEPRLQESGVRFHLPRSPDGEPARGRRRDRRSQRRHGGRGHQLLRIGQRRGELALLAGVERDHLVLAEDQLGPSLPPRSPDPEAQERHHHRRGQRDPGAAR